MTAPLVIDALTERDLPDARALLAAACRFDRAAEVAHEKLLGPAPSGPVVAWAARRGGTLAGVASATGDRLRLLAVAPADRGHGVGSALLREVEAAARTARVGALRTLDLPGNYLAPGIDVRNVDTIGWLRRRGWSAGRENLDLLIDVRTNPRVSAARADELAAASRAQGYEVRRAGRADEAMLAGAIEAEFGGAWAFEVTRALTAAPSGVHLALRDGHPAAFAAHDGNNQGLGWFGPAGTWAAHRGRGLGEALLLACLVDVAARHDVCEVAWIGPRAFYEKCAGVAGERRFVVMTKDLR